MHQMESQVSTSEALAITRRWNPTWNSKFFMVDYLTTEIAAIAIKHEYLPRSMDMFVYGITTVLVE